jgi:hypothetical protein
MFQDAVRRAGQSVAVVGGIALSLCLPYPAGAQGGFDGPGRYEVTNSKSGKVLDLDRNDQTRVMQFSSRGTDNQAWEIQSAGGGLYSLRSVMNGNALEAVGNSNSTPVRATRFDGRSSQQWRFDKGKDNSALIVSHVGKTLDIPGGSTSDGALVQIYDVNGDSNQRFTLRRVSANWGGGSSANASPTYPVAAPPTTSGGARTVLTPGWNMFSPQQDVELGQQASGEVAKQVLMLNDSRVDKYLNNLGQRLAAHAPGEKYPYAFQTVNDRGINAFALPGGAVFDDTCGNLIQIAEEKPS